jgi:glycosyltransferase involved in cell wall biosynthesis
LISVLILTRNEEQDLPGCLDSVSWCDDVHILDSESTDLTVAIAKERGAIITTRRFDGWPSQRNASMLLPFKHQWVFILDADERSTPELSAEMQHAVSHAAETVAGYSIRKRDFLWGIWLKHAQLTPFYIRLVRVGHVHYRREVNEVTEIEGEVGRLTGMFDHLAFSKGVAHWISKHNEYSSIEARLLAEGNAVRDASLKQALFAQNFHERRVAQKAIFYKMPGRPFVKWFYMMFIRGAVLDGHAGIMYAALQSFYEFLIEFKYRELLRIRAGKSL